MLHFILFQGTGEKPTQTADDQLLAHVKETQKVASYSRAENQTTQKGTGEKPAQVADDALMQHAREAQKTASYARREDVSTQKALSSLFSLFFLYFDSYRHHSHTHTLLSLSLSSPFCLPVLSVSGNR